MPAKLARARTGIEPHAQVYPDIICLAALSILAVLVAGLEGRLRVTLMGFDVATDLSVAVGALLAAAPFLSSWS